MEDDGKPRTLNLCLMCYSVRQEERTEPTRSGRRWTIVVGVPRQTVGPAMVHADLKNKNRACYAAKMMFAKSFLEDVATAVKLGESWTGESPYHSGQTFYIPQVRRLKGGVRP